MSKKVAITDVWIEDRDTELELPLGNGSVKVLAYAVYGPRSLFVANGRSEEPKERKEKEAGRGRKRYDKRCDDRR